MEIDHPPPRRQAFRATVQDNMRQTVGSLVNTSLIVMFCSLLFRLCKIGLIEYLLVTSEEECTKLESWVTGMLVLDCLYLSLTISGLVKVLHARGREVERSGFAALFSKWLDRGYLYGHILGNYLYFCTQQCQPAAPSLTDLTFWLLVLGYTYFLFPCWFFCAFCLCLPVIIFIIVKWNDYSKSDASDKQISALIDAHVQLLDKDDCPICSIALQPEEQLARMPCDERHVFHRSCITNWLKITPSCPICRYQAP